MSGDYTVGDTIYMRFTTRDGTGAPTTLSGTPAVSAYEDGSATQITAGITLGVDHDTVTGLNLLTIVASGANGFETGKFYDLVITAGTVDAISVVGEVVGRFSLEKSAAAIDLANGTDGLGAIKTETAAILVDTGTTLDGKINTIDTNVDAILVDTAEIGAAGAGLTEAGGTGDQLTAVPWNAAWDAEVESEVTDALNTYDPPTRTEATADKDELLEALGVNVTTIATLASQIEFTLTAGSADNDAYNDWVAIVIDQSTSAQRALGVVNDYVGSTKTVTLRADPAIFTMAVGDTVVLVPALATAGVNVSQINDTTVLGTGTSGDLWRG